MLKQNITERYIEGHSKIHKRGNSLYEHTGSSYRFKKSYIQVIDRIEERRNMYNNNAYTVNDFNNPFPSTIAEDKINDVKICTTP